MKNDCLSFKCFLQSPQKSFESVSPLSAAISETVPPLDGTDEVSISKAKPKPSATTAAAPKASLFSDEDEDLFGGNSVEEPKVEEKKEVISESPKPRKPVGAVSMFGGVDLFAGKRPSFLGEKNNAESSEPVKKEEGLFPKSPLFVFVTPHVVLTRHALSARESYLKDKTAVVKVIALVSTL